MKSIEWNLPFITGVILTVLTVLLFFSSTLNNDVDYTTIFLIIALHPIFFSVTPLLTRILRRALYDEPFLIEIYFAFLKGDINNYGKYIQRWFYLSFIVWILGIIGLITFQLMK
ncbi:MAG: hypothetical protein RLN79_11995 [Cytophagales bacterium]